MIWQTIGMRPTLTVARLLSRSSSASTISAEMQPSPTASVGKRCIAALATVKKCRQCG